MFGLAVACFADGPRTTRVLSEPATGSFQLRAALYAAQEHVTTHIAAADEYDRDRFVAGVVPCVTRQVRKASETDLLDGLGTAQALFTGGSSRPYHPAPVHGSTLFAEHAPRWSLTDGAVTEMSVRFTHLLSPKSGLEAAESCPRRRESGAVTDQLVPRLLLSKFGEHAPSWDMFKQIHTPETRVGDVVDMVVAVEQDS